MCDPAMQKPPILLVGTFLSGAGRSRSVCEDLSERLAGAGWQVITTSNQTGKLARLVDMLVTCWWNRREYMIAQVDVFSGPAFLWAEAVCGLLLLLGKPYILTLHGGNLPTFSRRCPGRVHRLLTSAAYVTVPSPYLLERMQPYHPDLILLPNAIDLDKYTYRSRAKPHSKLVWLRAFHAIYNPSLAPKMLAQLTTEFPEAELTMVGPDKGDGSLAETKAIAAELGVANQIQYTGGVPKTEVPRYLQQGDIFINTTNVDNTPVSVLEAMACGLCVVSTNVGGIQYMLENEVDALIVPPNNPQAMAAAVQRILFETELAEKLSILGYQKARRFDWSIILPQWVQLLQNPYG